MAAVALTTEQKLYARQTKLCDWCKGQMAVAGVKNIELAEYMGTTQQNIWKHFKTNTISVTMLLAICTLCDTPADELERILKI